MEPYRATAATEYPFNNIHLIMQMTGFENKKGHCYLFFHQQHLKPAKKNFKNSRVFGGNQFGPRKKLSVLKCSPRSGTELRMARSTFMSPLKFSPHTPSLGKRLARALASRELVVIFEQTQSLVRILGHSYSKRSCHGQNLWTLRCSMRRLRSRSEVPSQLLKE